MKVRSIFTALSVVSLLTGAACTSTKTQESTGEYVDSSIIATKVRAAIAKDNQLSIFPIDVKTYKDTVQLSGFVNSAAHKQRAEEIARTVKGIRTIENDLIIKN
ncbi:MAG: BON domain-containing protein [Rhodospirillales bacterium]